MKLPRSHLSISSERRRAQRTKQNSPGHNFGKKQMRCRFSRLLLSVIACSLICLGCLFISLHGPEAPGADENAECIANDVRATATPTPRPTPSAGAGDSPAGVETVGTRIPMILHQTWISDTIPSTYIPFVSSWTAHQPQLSYYYWTDAKSVEFVAKYYPHLLSMFKGYKAHLNRADAIRYMLLHRYGGIYADMDMMRLKDLAPMLNSSKELCYLSQERYEITRLFWGLNSSVMNAIMLSSPGHRFMEFAVNALPRYAHHSPNVMESTGPFFLQNVYNEFMKSPPCNLAQATCRCFVADPYVFMPQVDPIRIPQFRLKCLGTVKARSAQEACEMLDKIGWVNDVDLIGKDSYTHHGFLHFGFQNQKMHFQSIVDIGSVRKDRRTFGVDFL